MSRFEYTEYIKRYFKPELLTAEELKQVVMVIGKNKKVQKLIDKDSQLISLVLKQIHKEKTNG